MHLTRSHSLLLPLLALPLALLGCERRACFHWSEIEGVCPSPDEALVFFQNPGCLNAVRSIDSAGDFDGDLCCYDVTAYDTGDEACEAPVSIPGNGGIDKPAPAPPPVSGGGSTGTGPMRD